MKDELQKILNEIAIQAKNIMKNKKIKYSDSEQSDKLILEYMNACTKQIVKNKIKVKYSCELRNKISEKNFVKNDMIVSDEEAGDIIERITRFEKFFLNGEEVCYHLSRKAFDSTIFDTLLNAWNIKHIHLSLNESTSKNSMKRNRSEWLLFFTIKNKCAYFFDVRQHPSSEKFMAYDFLKIAHQNDWMEIIGFTKIDGIVPGSLEPKITDDKTIYELYKSGINIAFEVCGTAYHNTGIVSSGDKSENALKLLKLKEYLKKLLSSSELEYSEIEFESKTSFIGRLYLKFCDKNLVYSLDFNKLFGEI